MTIEKTVQHFCANGCKEITEMKVEGPISSQSTEEGRKEIYQYECTGCNQITYSIEVYRQE